MVNVLITGCRGGIGLNVAERLLKKGNKVYVTIHKKDSIDEIKVKLKKYKNAVIEKLDLLNDSDIKKVEKWEIDILINNAAIGNSGPLAEIPLKKIREVFETNVFSTLKLTQKVLKKMIPKKSGRIIFVSSIAGLIPTPFLSPYAMTKFSLENIIFSLRDELKPFNINVIAINPGAYNTGFNQKNINKKYEWLNKKGLYKDNLKQIKNSEKNLLRFELKNTDSIAKEIVKATLAKNPKRRYSAPWWQYISVPFFRWFF